MERYPASPRMAWGLGEISECTGLSLGFLRAEVRAGRLPVRRFGRRVLVKNEDLEAYLERGSERSKNRARDANNSTRRGPYDTDEDSGTQQLDDAPPDNSRRRKNSPM